MVQNFGFDDLSSSTQVVCLEKMDPSDFLVLCLGPRIGGSLPCSILPLLKGMHALRRQRLPSLAWSGTSAASAAFSEDLEQRPHRVRRAGRRPARRTSGRRSTVSVVSVVSAVTRSTTRGTDSTVQPIDAIVLGVAEEHSRLVSG